MQCPHLSRLVQIGRGSEPEPDAIVSEVSAEGLGVATGVDFGVETDLVAFFVFTAFFGTVSVPATS